MGRLALMIWLWPAVALADPRAAATPTAAPVSPDQAPPPAFAVAAPASHPHLSTGWGLYATFHGRSTDLDSGAIDWTEDPHVQRNEIEVGYGWRSGAAAALFGFDQHDYGPNAPRYVAHVRNPNEPPSVQGDGVIGFSLVLHGR